MNNQNRQSFRMRVTWSFILLLLMSMSLLYARPVVKADGPQRAEAAHARAVQNPSQAESYRRLAAAKRKAAENVPAKRDCYLTWAKYYDCLAGKYETGDSRDCGKEPPAC
jgi:hypothetical protein